MWMVLLYGVATFMETGVGVWMFGRMFPERKSSSEYRWAKMILLTLLILTTYTMHRAYGQEYIYEKFFFIVVYAGVMISDAILYKYRDFFRINKKTEYSNAIVHAFQGFRAPFSGKIVHIFPEQSAAFN